MGAVMGIMGIENDKFVDRSTKLKGIEIKEKLNCEKI